MNASDDCIGKIAAIEVFRATPYPDWGGVITIGFGHVMRLGDTYASLTRDDATELLRMDVRVAEEAIAKLVRVTLTQNQFDALVSFTFNEGGGRLASSTLLKLLNAGDYAGAADQFLVWDKYHDAKGILRTSPSLSSRRASERETFLTP